MTYMGGKQKLSKHIVPFINNYIKDNNIENFYDIFCGGFNIGCHINCENIYANDLCPTLIALHRAAQEDFNLICKNSSREQWDRCYTEYKRIRTNNFEDSSIPLAEIGAIEWLASYSGRGFPGGYGVKSVGRNLFEERLRNLKNQSFLPSYQKAIFTCQDYRNVEIKHNSLIYCDSPYAGTKTYGINSKFNYEDYYNWLIKTAKTTPIFISEQSLPEIVPARIIWQKEVKRDIGNKKEATETLYFLDLRE